MSAYTRPVSKIAILSDANDAPGGALCSVHPGGSGGGGLYVDLSIVSEKKELISETLYGSIHMHLKSTYLVKSVFVNPGVPELPTDSYFRYG